MKQLQNAGRVSAGPSALISDDFHTRNYDEKKDLTLDVPARRRVMPLLV